MFPTIAELPDADVMQVVSNGRRNVLNLFNGFKYDPPRCFFMVGKRKKPHGT
jgi:hypothetical protein